MIRRLPARLPGLADAVTTEGLSHLCDNARNHSVKECVCTQSSSSDRETSCLISSFPLSAHLQLTVIHSGPLQSYNWRLEFLSDIVYIFLMEVKIVEVLNFPMPPSGHAL